VAIREPIVSSITKERPVMKKLLDLSLEELNRPMKTWHYWATQIAVVVVHIIIDYLKDFIVH
jgi:hypothetical protein